MTITARSGQQTISVDPALERLLSRVLSAVAPTTKRLMGEASTELRQQASENSPVKKGTFRDSWVSGFAIVNATTVEAFIGNTDPKARFIKRPWPARGFVWRKLLLTPGRKRAKLLAEELAPELVKKVT